MANIARTAVKCVAALLLVLVIGVIMPCVHAQTPAPAPMSDGGSIDQGVAYVLLFAALALMYLFHPLDAFP
eukprot:Gb_34537 [translate_table: standard]